MPTTEDDVAELQAQADKLRDDIAKSKATGLQNQEQASLDLQKQLLQADIAVLERKKARAARAASKAEIKAGLAPVVEVAAEEKKAAAAGAKADAKTNGE